MFRGKGYFCHIRCHESNCSKCYCPFKHSGETDTSKDILTAVDIETFQVTDEMRTLINKELEDFEKTLNNDSPKNGSPANDSSANKRGLLVINDSSAVNDSSAMTSTNLDLSIPGDQTYAASVPNLSIVEPPAIEENGKNCEEEKSDKEKSDGEKSDGENSEKSQNDESHNGTLSEEETEEDAKVREEKHKLFLEKIKKMKEKKAGKRKEKETVSHNEFCYVIGQSQVKWVAYFSWSFGSNSAWGSKESTSTGKRHSSLRTVLLHYVTEPFPYVTGCFSLRNNHFRCVGCAA